ncbi:MAG: hypothetical protein PVG32_07615 [Anaerolineales bacterium]|jgi:hypothetical protein
MRKHLLLFLSISVLVLLVFFGIQRTVFSETTAQLSGCADFAYSTEEDFITQGPTPPDGVSYISDGDLLGANHTVCMRNRDLLSVFDVPEDLGLDAVDVIDVEKELVAFSTELNDPAKRFTEGDLLTTWGAVIPNQVLLTLFQVQGDRGLDAVHFVGDIQNILAFHDAITSITRDEWLKDPGALSNLLTEYEVELWFSIEGTELSAATVSILDGDLLSAQGTIKLSNADLLPASVPAGLPSRGVDFGLDAFSAERSLDTLEGVFSTEILYQDKTSFTDGDVILVGNGVDTPDVDLYTPFEPLADFLGTDALHQSAVPPQPTFFDIYLPLVQRFIQQLFP